MFFVHVIAKEPPPLPDTSPNGSPGTKCSSTTTTTGTHRGCRQVDLHFGYPKGLDESFREADWGHATSSRKQVISAIARAPYYREAFTGQRAKIFHKSFKDMEIVLSSEGKDAVSKMGGQSRSETRLSRKSCKGQEIHESASRPKKQSPAKIVRNLQK